jgi:hypothetical protein
MFPANPHCSAIIESTANIEALEGPASTKPITNSNATLERTTINNISQDVLLAILA